MHVHVGSMSCTASGGIETMANDYAQGVQISVVLSPSGVPLEGHLGGRRHGCIHVVPFGYSETLVLFSKTVYTWKTSRSKLSL